MLRGLSVFAGGWTLEGAVRVVGEQTDEDAVLDALTRLIDQSLVIIQRAEDGTTRYSMLETVRQYVQDRLNEAGEAEAARNRHLDFYAALAEEARPQLVGRHEGAWLARLDLERENCAWLARLDLERENFLAARPWCGQVQEFGEIGLRLVFSLLMYLRQRLLLTLGHRIVVEALARPGAQGCTVARCRALWAAAELAYFMGRYDQSKDYVEKSLIIAREIGDDERAAEAVWR